MLTIQVFETEQPGIVCRFVSRQKDERCDHVVIVRVPTSHTASSGDAVCERTFADVIKGQRPSDRWMAATGFDNDAPMPCAAIGGDKSVVPCEDPWCTTDPWSGSVGLSPAGRVVDNAWQVLMGRGLVEPPKNIFRNVFYILRKNKRLLARG